MTTAGAPEAAALTVGALISVERRLGTAAELAGELATSLHRREADLAEIWVQTRKISHADEPRPYLHHAVDLAALTERGLQTSADVGDELLVYLDLARKDLLFGSETIAESASLAEAAGMSAPELGDLPHRVGHLGRIIQSATGGAERVSAHLEAAEQAVGELARRPSFAVSEDGEKALRLPLSSMSATLT